MSYKDCCLLSQHFNVSLADEIDSNDFSFSVALSGDTCNLIWGMDTRTNMDYSYSRLEVYAVHVFVCTCMCV